MEIKWKSEHEGKQELTVAGVYGKAGVKLKALESQLIKVMDWLTGVQIATDAVQYYT